ncbi:MAG TPA: bifunctional DNA-binding transcriptional regulator/O6-methylguanine-DNA methyltransferase Ada [Methylotenera sp.]|nr:bifunctional DNA-binding transcriptional regulator/O6-methylguanine-DNA methyltransferase Ada [Methylotenera sp.]
MTILSTNALKVARKTTVEADPRWLRVQDRDHTADGKFYYSVSTTGVYCKPSCVARAARPEHVQFHTTCADAERAGFRACKRCKPGQADLAETHAKLIADSCRLIETAASTLTLEDLATKAGLSSYHFHRVFKAVTGLTPKDYAAAHRAKKIRHELRKNTSVTDAIFEAGYHSNSRFYEKSAEVLGMTPSNYKAGGSNTVLRFAIGECSLGTILVASSKRGVSAIFIGLDPEALIKDLQDAFPRAQLIGADKDYEALVAKVVGLIEAPLSNQEIIQHLPLDIRGTAFQQRVWQALQQIPFGKTVSYSELAALIGLPKAVRAVANACAANKLAVAIPCHRVVRTDGSLSGYRWGVERKKALLDLESKANQ